MGKRPRKRLPSKTELRSARKRGTEDIETQAPSSTVVESKPKDRQSIELPATIVIREFAERLGLPVGKIMGELLKNGIQATLNDSVDFDTAAIVADELEFEAVREVEAGAVDEEVDSDPTKLKPRPPVVTVMGHVDHGKTKLLDAIRRTNIVEQESGGITQHIGAYQVEIKNRPITFLDTPGHEAFAALRAHGANITDIVILVVAANEGVKPQTIEALSHARAANVPIIVALTKIDLPDANLDRAKKELADHGLISEEWGGKTPMVAVSAKSGENIDQLLEMVLLVADVAELKANYDQPAMGVVVESHLQAGLGPLATILVQNGRLKVGDTLTAGQTFGRIRVIEDWRGKRIKEAMPAMPVQVAGLKSVPQFGDRFRVVADEHTARQLTQTKSAVRRTISLGSLSASIKEGATKDLPIVLKADVQGSVEAIKTSLTNLSGEEVAVKLIHCGIGPVSDSDVNLAATGGGLVLAFRVPILPSAKKMAEQTKVEISSYEIIYQLIDEMSAALSGLLAPEIVEVDLGRLTVIKVFKVHGSEIVLGGRVTDGELVRNTFAKVMRGGATIGEGKIVTLQREKESTTTVGKGFECGVGVEGKIPIEIGDELIAFKTEERSRKIKSN